MSKPAKPLIIPVFIPHMGCGHICVFCNQRKIAGDYLLPTAKGLLEEIHSYRQSCRQIADREVQLAFYGGSFTGLEVSVQEHLLSLAAKFKKENLIDKIRMSTRPDYIDQAVIERLQYYQADIVELGVQSLDAEVLIQSKRGHTVCQVETAVALLKETSMQLGLQMMVALPADTPELSLRTAQKIVALAPDFVRIYPTAVIKDTELAELWLSGAYEPWSMETVVDTVAEAVLLFNAADIPIIRIGLQATDQLVYGQDLLAGAFHPAMGELVKGRIFRWQIEEQLPKNAMQIRQQVLRVYCRPEERSQLIGQKKCNLHYFQAKYGLSLEFVNDQTLAVGKCRLTAKIL